MKKMTLFLTMLFVAALETNCMNNDGGAPLMRPEPPREWLASLDTNRLALELAGKIEGVEEDWDLLRDGVICGDCHPLDALARAEALFQVILNVHAFSDDVHLSEEHLRKHYQLGEIIRRFVRRVNVRFERPAR